MLETAPKAVAIERPRGEPPPALVAAAPASAAEPEPEPPPVAAPPPREPLPSVALPPPPIVIELPPPQTPKETVVTEKIASAEATEPRAKPTSAVFVSTAPIAPPEAVPLRGGIQLRPDRHADQQLRSVIMAHEADLQKCVERQLKLVPGTKAEGTLVVDVDAKGRVPGLALRGPGLGGSALELCLRKVSQRWRFPRTGHAYSVQAPVKVRGR